jgi:predicted transcriptional regulator
MHLVLDRFSNALGYLLRHLHLLQCLPETHLIGLPLVLRDPGVYAQVYREHRTRLSLQTLFESPNVFSLRRHASPLLSL